MKQPNDTRTLALALMTRTVSLTFEEQMVLENAILARIHECKRLNGFFAGEYWADQEAEASALMKKVRGGW
jgi:hypothetical protein